MPFAWTTSPELEIAGKIETNYRRLGKARPVEAARGVTKVVIVKFDFRAVAKLIFEIFGQTPVVINVGFQRRANPVDVLNGDAGLLQTKSDSAPRKLPARVLRQRKPLFFGRRNQLSVAKQNRSAIVVTVLDPGANANHIHFVLYLLLGTPRAEQRG